MIFLAETVLFQYSDHLVDFTLLEGTEQRATNRLQMATKLAVRSSLCKTFLSCFALMLGVVLVECFDAANCAVDPAGAQSLRPVPSHGAPSAMWLSPRFVSPAPEEHMHAPKK